MAVEWYMRGRCIRASVVQVSVAGFQSSASYTASAVFAPAVDRPPPVARTVPSGSTGGGGRGGRSWVWFGGQGLATTRPTPPGRPPPLVGRRRPPGGGAAVGPRGGALFFPPRPHARAPGL